MGLDLPAKFLDLELRLGVALSIQVGNLRLKIGYALLSLCYLLFLSLDHLLVVLLHLHVVFGVRGFAHGFPSRRLSELLVGSLVDLVLLGGTAVAHLINFSQLLP